MVNKKILDYLKNGLSKGYSITSLKTALIKQGQSKEDIDKAARQLNPPKKNVKILPVIAVLVIIILGVGIAYIINKQQPSTGGENDQGLQDNTKANIERKLGLCLESADVYDPVCLALLESDEESCAELSSNRDTCYLHIALKKAILSGDKNDCEIVKKSGLDESEKIISFCSAILNNQPAGCELLEGTDLMYQGDKTTCNAITSDDAGLCEQLENEARRSCIVIFYSIKNLRSDDNENCNMIQKLVNVSEKEAFSDLNFCLRLAAKDKNACLSFETEEIEKRFIDCYEAYGYEVQEMH